jgi:Protein of unknown function (DUF2868)
MTEDEARQVLLLQSHEADAADSAVWSADDRRWATRQAVAALGEQAAPERFVVARAAIALQRLLPRDAAGRRWLGRRAWHPAWVALAGALGLLAGLAADQLGTPQRVNLLAPAVWAVVAWNLLVYLALLLPTSAHGLRAVLSRRALRGEASVAALWARHAAPLTTTRLALLLHMAAAGLALGLVAGLYLRGLVLDYRAGWQSTFASAGAVQTALDWLLAPASLVTGLAVPDVAPLQLAPGADATASAAAWIHLLAATLALAVLVPRLLLAWHAASRARRLARSFPLPLDSAYFESLHPLMRPGLPPTVRLLWLPATTPPPGLALFDTAIGDGDEAVDAATGGVHTLVRSDEGDSLQLHPLPAGLLGGTQVDHVAPPWWQRWLQAAAPGQSPMARLRAATDAVLLLTRPGQPPPGWLAELGRPVVNLVDADDAEPPRLSLHARADGWLAEGRLLAAIDAALPGDPRMQRLRAAWLAQQLARLDEGMQVLAEALGHIAAAHQPVADAGFLSRRAEAEAARAALAVSLDAQWRRCEAGLAALKLTGGSTDAGAVGALSGGSTDEGAAGAVPPALSGQLKARLGEGRAALVGGVVTGALAGLKADVLSGGLTMGGGMLAGGLLGALGAAGMAKGLNVVRGTERSYAAWDDAALGAVTEGLLQRYLWLAHGLGADEARQQFAPALASQQAALNALWQGRERRVDNDGEAARLTAQLQPLLRQVVQQALPARQPALPRNG